MTFVAALMDWVGEAKPTEDDLIRRRVLKQGLAHVNTIRQTGGVILGCRPLHLDGVTGLQEVTHRRGGTVYIYEGATRLRPATQDERDARPVFSTWGLDVIRVAAESRFVSR